MNFKLKNIIKYVLFKGSLFTDSLMIICFILLFILVRNIKQNFNQPKCLLSSAVLNTASVDGSTVNFSWVNGQKSDGAYLNVANSSALWSDGVLQKVDIYNDTVTGKTSFTMNNLNPGTYYWNIISDGCQPAQRKVSNLGSFTVQ